MILSYTTKSWLTVSETDKTKKKKQNNFPDKLCTSTQKLQISLKLKNQ